MPVSETDLLRHVWEYPLFDALYGRRSRRFGLGFDMTEGPFRHRSQHAALPLNELEEALLVAAGVGFSGTALWEHSRLLARLPYGGRTFPSTSGGRRTALFFTNDAGVHVIDPDAPEAAALRAVDSPAARPTILELYRNHRRTLQPGRLAIPRRVPPLSGHNLWDSNMPGATLFVPVCDVTRSLISLISQFVDGALGRFVDHGARGMSIVDDRHGFRPAGTDAWLRNGFLDPQRPLPLSVLERQACYFTFSEPAAICQNMFLATEAIGIGGWMHCGFLSFELLQALGFRMVAPPDAPLLAHPVGLDGVFQSYCPPYFATMDAAVDAVLAPADTTPGRAPVPHRLPAEAPLAGTVQVSAEGIACTKAICRYIIETYGRFPATVDAMHLMWVMQAHHLDTDFYDRHFHPDAYGATHAGHLAIWHR
ncbi:MAG TPA: hypothetical protein VMB81_11605 [Candidatus Sulfotelmatobacter sp.]|nr:hypothetical protein [Candidatus Sulfotelmatobacter sp.]